MTRLERKDYRQKLVAMIRNLQGEQSQLRHEVLGETGGTAADDSSDDDVGRQRLDEEVALALLGTEEGLLAECQAALQRMKEGTFGICTECRRPIAKERLRAAPYAKSCIRCATAPKAKAE